MGLVYIYFIIKQGEHTVVNAPLLPPLVKSAEIGKNGRTMVESTESKFWAIGSQNG